MENLRSSRRQSKAWTGPYSPSRRITRRFFLLLFACLLLSSCTSLRDPEASQEQRTDTVATLNPGIRVGQSFVSRRSRLDGVDIWVHLPPGYSTGKSITARLFLGDDETTQLAEIIIPYETAATAYPLKIQFKPQPSQAGQAYRLELSADGSPVSLYGRNEDSYPHGALFYNGVASQADLSFRLSYDYDYQAMLSDFLAWLEKTWLVLPLAALLWLPGAVFWNLTGKKHSFGSGRLDLFQSISLKVGLSAALVAVSMLWSSVLGLTWSRNALVAISILLLFVLVWQSRQGLIVISRKFIEKASGASRIANPVRRPTRPDAISLGLGALLVASLAVRLAMVRDLAAPPWVDSVHHAVITRLIMELGRLPDTYAPYIATQTASYHSGYHSMLAGFLWLSGLPMVYGMLIFGQILNTLAILSVYLFTVTLTHRRSAGLVAVLIAGLLSPMPAYYTSWGRYTQLAGVLILPAAFVITKTLMEHPPRKLFSIEALRSALLAGVVCAGLFLTHYRVAIFLACLLAAHALTLILRWARKRALLTGVLVIATGLAISFLAALLISLPWLPDTVTSLAIPTSRPVANAPRFFSDFSWGILTTAHGKLVLALGAAGLLLALFHKRPFALTMALWVGFMFLLANFSSLGLPGGWYVNHTSVEILLYLPLAMLGGYFISSLVNISIVFLPGSLHPAGAWALGIAGAITAILGARALLPILNPITFLARQPDYAGITWLEENLPPGERILINPFAWGYGAYAGQDGGYWITPLSGRPTLPPPVLESVANQRERVQQNASLAQQVLEVASDPQALYALMETQELHYIFIGTRGGVLSPHLLSESGLFETLYNQEGVWIFERNEK